MLLGSAVAGCFDLDEAPFQTPPPVPPPVNLVWAKSMGGPGNQEA
jgi:hypothetical protein